MLNCHNPCSYNRKFSTAKALLVIIHIFLCLNETLFITAGLKKQKSASIFSRNDSTPPTSEVSDLLLIHLPPPPHSPIAAATGLQFFCNTSPECRRLNFLQVFKRNFLHSCISSSPENRRRSFFLFYSDTSDNSSEARGCLQKC